MLLARAALLGGAFFLACARGDGEGAFPGCTAEGTGVSRHVRALNRLKNRAHAPAAQDVDSRVTLDALLASGDDHARWNDQQAATIVGYVRAVSVGGVETTNCLARDPDRRDTHIELVAHPGNAGAATVIVEVTPAWRARAAATGRDWSTDALRASLLGHWVSVTGWLLFDWEHDRESENTAPGRAGNWRGTGWEIHPVTALQPVLPDR